LVVERLRLLLTLDTNKEISPKDLVIGGFCDPMKVFAKGEPHKSSKISEGRIRLICGVSLIDNVIARLLCSLQNNTEIVLADILPVKPGMGLHDEGLESLSFYFNSMYSKGPLSEADVKGWDWSFQSRDFDFDVERRIELAHAEGTIYARLLRAHFYCMARKVFLLSDGSMIQQLKPGIMPSGWYNTSSTNSNVRCGLHYELALQAGEIPSIMAMGDDSVERSFPNAIEAYAELGKTVSFFRDATPKSFEFCSTLFTGVLGYPINIDKQIYNLLSTTPNNIVELNTRLLGFEYEIRNHPEFNEIKQLIIDSGWTTQDFKNAEDQDKILMGSRGVIDQNSFCANQNAKRLHGSTFPGCPSMYSPVSSLRYPIQMTNKRNNNKRKVAAPSQKQTINNIVQAAVSAAVKKVNPTLQQKGNNTTLGDLGMLAGNGISKIFGLGAYKLKSNSLYRTSNQVPVMHSASESIIFRHREYIGDVSSTNAFTVVQYPINPGLPQSFPYLSTVASCFQEYKFRGLIYEFKSSGADALVSGTNTAMGTVSMVAQYRADAQPLQNKIEVLNEMWSTTAKTSDNTILPIECAPKENPMAVQYVRTGAGYSGDIKLYDLAVLTVATGGSQGNNVIGELWASYEVEFLKPTLSVTGGVLAADHYVRSGTGVAPLGLIGVSKPVSTLGTTVTGNAITFPVGIVGRYSIVLYHLGTAAVLSYGAVTITNGTLLPVIAGLTYVAQPSNAISSVQFLETVVIDIPPSTVACVVTFPNGTYPTASTIDLSITETVDYYA